MEENQSILDKSKQGKNLNGKDQNNSILSQQPKGDLKINRYYKSQNEILEKEIGELTEVCYGLKDNILTAKERLDEIKKEIRSI